MSVTTIVRMRARYRHGPALRDVLAGPVSETRKQPACEAIDLFIRADDDEDFLLVARWSSVEAQTAYYDDLVACGALEAALPLLAAPPESTHLEEIPVH